MTQKEIKTAAWISIPDFREVCKAVDSEIRTDFSDVFAQSRTLDKAMDYVGALSDPRVRGNSWNIGEWCGYVNPRPVQSLTGENKWDPGEMWNRIAVIAGHLAELDCANDPVGPGVIVDETAQEKRGMATAGVGHQYAGCAGKVVNCVNWVFLTMAGPFMRTWAGAGLYIPQKSWLTGRKETGTARRRSVSIRKSCERSCRWPVWRSLAATPVMVLSQAVFPGAGGGWAQVRRSSGLAAHGRNRSRAGPVRGLPLPRPHSSR